MTEGYFVGNQNHEPKNGKNSRLRHFSTSCKNRKSRRNFALCKIPAQKSRYCQLLMLARKGQALMMTAEDLACPAAKAALGFAPLPEKISSGEMLCTLGLFGSKEAAARTMKMIPRISLGSIKAVVAGPLENFPVTPDIVVIESILNTSCGFA